MSNQQPEALRLADELGACPTINYRRHAETLRRQHAEIERLTVERDAAIDARRAAQLRQEQLTAEIVSLEPMRQRAADIERPATGRHTRQHHHSTPPAGADDGDAAGGGVEDK